MMTQDNFLRRTLEMNTLVKIAVAAGIVAGGIVFSAYLLSRFYLTVEKEKIITVKGLAQERITSDKASVRGTITVQAKIISEGYKELAGQMEDIRAQLKTVGVGDGELNENNVVLNKVYKTNEHGNMTNELDYYEVFKSFEITSNDVHKIEKVAMTLGDLLIKDFEISIDGPYYYVTSIEQAKLRLLGKATENAFQRANLIADNSGGKTGKLVEASQGIFQITEPDSTEVSDYGMYSISTIEKDIKAVVTLKYRIED